MKIPIENFEIAYFSMHDGKRKLIENCVLTSRWCIIEYSKNWCYFCRRLRRTRYLAGKLAVSARELLIPFYITASIHQRFSLMCIYAHISKHPCLRSHLSKWYSTFVFFNDTVGRVKYKSNIISSVLQSSTALY